MHGNAVAFNAVRPPASDSEQTNECTPKNSDLGERKKDQGTHDTALPATNYKPTRSKHNAHTHTHSHALSRTLLHKYAQPMRVSVGLGVQLGHACGSRVAHDVQLSAANIKHIPTER